MSPGPEDEVSQAEKRAVMRQDADVRDRSRNGDTGTFLSHTHIDDAGGRFQTVNAASIVGSQEAVARMYPAASSAYQTQLPDELPTGYRIDAMPELETAGDHSPPAADDPADAPLPGYKTAPADSAASCERAGSSSSNKSE